MTLDRKAYVLFILVILISNIGCSRGEMNNQTNSTYDAEPISEAVWEKLSSQKIFFGHMSVGYNILEGVVDLSRISPGAKIRISESADPSKLGDGAWLHSKIGKNTDPYSKIDDFERAIDNGLGSQLEVAFLKLCYVDIVGDTDVEKVFSSYKSTITRLKSKYPSIKIVHFTPPLTRLQTGPKAWIKKAIGKPLYGARENVKRTEFANLLKHEYGKENAVFDLAAIESTHFNGDKESYYSKGKQYPQLIADYTNDGGHLNAVGRKWVAEKLLVFLGGL